MTSLKRAITPLDAVLTAVLVACAVLFMVAVVDEEGGSWAAVPLFALVPLVLLWRRTAPLQALAGLILAVGVHIMWFGTVTRCGLFLPVDLLLAFAAGARLPARMALVGWALALGGALFMLGFDQSAPLEEAGVFVSGLITGVWVAGAVLHAVSTRESAAPAGLEPART
jgi:hypothetical protein